MRKFIVSACLVVLMLASLNAAGSGFYACGQSNFYTAGTSPLFGAVRTVLQREEDGYTTQYSFSREGLPTKFQGYSSREEYVWHGNKLIEKKIFLDNDKGKLSERYDFSYNEGGEIFKVTFSTPAKKGMNVQAITYVERKKDKGITTDYCVTKGYGGDPASELHLGLYDETGNELVVIVYVNTVLKLPGSNFNSFEKINSEEQMGGVLAELSTTPITDCKWNGLEGRRYDKKQEDDGYSVSEYYCFVNKMASKEWFDKDGFRTEEVASLTETPRRTAYRYKKDGKGNWVEMTVFDYKFLGLDKKEKYGWKKRGVVTREISYW